MPSNEFELIRRYFWSLGAAGGSSAGATTRRDPATVGATTRRDPGSAGATRPAPGTCRDSEAARSPIFLGIGDDAALLDLPPGEALVTSVDTLVEGVHYPEDTFPEDVGYRALAVAASDLAAMGATPLACTLALTLPAVDELWLQAFSEGLARACAAFHLPLAGGDTTRGPATVITLQVFGACPADAALRRDGARPGDQVCVSGTVGDAAAALAILEERWHPAWPAAGAGEAGDGTGSAATRFPDTASVDAASVDAASIDAASVDATAADAAAADAAADTAEALLARFNRPTPRLALGEGLRGVASAAIDVSDGLLADLGHIAAASGVAIALDSAALPLSPALAAAGEQGRSWALGGGDDYELAFTLPPGAAVPEGCTRIGEVREGTGLSVDGEPADASGYRHF